jgi:hypothetical protein
MRTYIERLRQGTTNERGAEIVEWVLWVGGIALLASAMFTLLSGQLTNLATTIITGMSPVSGS